MTIVTVIGAGAWGTALAMVLARNGHQVWLYGREHDLLQQMQQDRMNQAYLPGYPFPSQLASTTDLPKALAQSDWILLAIPSDGFVEQIQVLAEAGVLPRLPFIWACKGLDPHTDDLLHATALRLLGNSAHYGVITGPSFAKEVAAGLPTAVTMAAPTRELAETFAHYFHSSHFRVYPCTDVSGAELGGAIKNVYAIAAGVADGLGFGANARSALITRALAEMQRLGEALDANARTLAGLAGMGDLVLSCTDDQSRNRRFGLALGQGKSVKEVLDTISHVVEGYHNTPRVIRLAKRSHVDMPIAECVHQVLYEGVSPHQAVESLLARDMRFER